jgi:predicted nucleic acid-binding protein
MACSKIIRAWPLFPDLVLPESLYLDSNVLIAFFDKNHQSHLNASQLLLETKASNVNIYISSLVLDEVWYVLMRSWQRQELDINFNSKNKAHLQLYGTCLERITNDILKLLQAQLLPLETQKSSDIVKFALKLLVEEHLAPRDII